jgi:arabinose-5-phosphate isomerase
MTTVLDADGMLIGIFTDGDVRRALDNNADIHNTCVENIMTKSPKTIKRDMLAAEALNIMETHKITSLVITNEHHHPDGILHIHDILRAGVI